MKRSLKITAAILAAFVATSLSACTIPSGSSNGNTGGDSPSQGGVIEEPDGDEGIAIIINGIGFSRTGGVYEKPFLLSVEPQYEGNTLRYTLDGSQPTASSPTVADAIYVSNEPKQNLLSDGIVWSVSNYGSYSIAAGDTCLPIRVAEFDARGNAIAEAVQTYFIRLAGASAFSLPVISLTLPPETALSFYNDIENESKERANLEYFDFASGEQFARNTQVKLGGNWTKGFPYRTINVNFNKDENGSKNIPVSVDLFQGRPARDGGELTNFTRFRLHSGGNAQTIAWFQDAYTQRVAAEISYVNESNEYEKLNVSTTGYRPCELYINGEYWGLYAMREHYSDVYFAQNYGVDKDDVILIDRAYSIVESDEYSDSSVFNTRYHFEVAEDSDDGEGMSLATELFDYLYNTDFSVAQNYEQLKKTVDLDSLIDMVLVHFYAGNWDFMNNNIKMWRTATVDPSNPYADGKWRFCLHDLDFSFEYAWGDVGLAGANGYTLDVNYLDFYLGNAYLTYNGVGTLDKRQTCLLSSPMQNEDFRARLLKRADYVQQIYTDPAAQTVLSNMRAEVSEPMRRHLNHWNRTGYGYADWSERVDNMSLVLDKRCTLYENYYPNGDYFISQTRAAISRYLRGY